MLPSGGTFSFLTDFICETNNTCYDSPKEKPKTYQIRKFSEQSIEFLNRNNILESLNEILGYVPLFNRQRLDAENVSKQIMLSNILLIPITEFSSHFTDISKNFNTTVIEILLNSTPNFNMMFSSYSTDYSEPIIPTENYEHYKKAENLINLLYGPNLEVIY